MNKSYDKFEKELLKNGLTKRAMKLDNKATKIYDKYTKKYGKAIKYNKKTKKYEIDKNADDYKKAKKSTIKKAAIGTAAVVGATAAALGIKRRNDIKKRLSKRQLKNMGIKLLKGG